MGDFENEVLQLIEFRHGNRAAFAREIGMPAQTLYSALSHNITTASFSTVMPIIAALDVDPMEFMRNHLVPNDRRKGAVDVPFFGSISAGQPIERSQADDTFPIPAVLHERYPDAFMLRVEGTSMNRMLPDGYYVLVNPCPTVETSGQIYVVAVGQDAATVKHVRLLSNGLELLPDSDDPTHHPIVFDYADENAPEVRVIGRVVWHCPPIDEGWPIT